MNQTDAREEPLVSVARLRVEFDTDGGTVVGVDDVSLQIKAGETVCVVGESGSGKSVTSLAVMRLVEFGGGRITAGNLKLRLTDGSTFDLAQADAASMQAIRGDEIGMIFQEPMTSLNPVFTIGRQLTDGLRVHRKMSRSDARAHAISMLEGVRIPEPEQRLGQYPHELSGGMRQRIMIAMAMACEPRLLIADEPTTALDVTIQAEILALIDRLKRENGMAVLFITHDMAVVAQMADRVVVMHRGRIVEEGPVAQIFDAPRDDYTRMLLAAVPRLGDMRGKAGPEPMLALGLAPPRGAAVTRSPNHTASDSMAQARAVLAADSGSDLAKFQPVGKVLLEVRNLTTRFPVKGGLLNRTVANVHAVEDVSFKINVGETLALVGESGSGKSSCGRSILRLVEPLHGSIRLGDRDVRQLDGAALREARREMQMIFQDPFASLNPYRRLFDQVAEPLTNFGIASGSECSHRVATLFDRVGLPRDFLRRFPHELSGGQRQRVAIARAIAPNPGLVVADEAVSALDVSVQAQVLNLLMELQADLGVSFLFISHDMAVVERISHQVGVMYMGRIVEIGSRADVFENPQHPYTKSLMAAVPIADPHRRRNHEVSRAKALPSAIHPVGYESGPSAYREVSPGHRVAAVD